MKNVAAVAAAVLFSATLAQADALSVFNSGKFGSVGFIAPVKGEKSLNADQGSAWRDAAKKVIAEQTDLLRATGSEELVPVQIFGDEQGQVHVRYQQYIRGFKVVGGEMIFHADAKSGKIELINGVFVPDTDLNTKATIKGRDALLAAIEEAGIENGRLVGRPSLVYVVNGDDATLAWSGRVDYTSKDGIEVDIIFADASNGDFVTKHPQIHRLKNRKTYNGNNGSSLPGTLMFSEGGTTTDTTAKAAYDNGGITYDFYKLRFNRDSYDNAGATISQTVHHQLNYNNAFWNGSQMVYGDGDGTTFAPLSKSLDVVAHELTHAVTERTAGLVYQNESGALNEAMSDIMGAASESYSKGGVVDSTIWMIGDTIYTPNTAGDALRYMNNPTQDGSSKDYYPERYVGASDNGGVHWNSGIANLAFKLLVTGGSHPRSKTTVVVPALGMAKAEQIFYKALSTYMTSSTNFQGARNATASATTALGYTSTDLDAVHKAWDAVGVPGGAAPPPAATVVLSNGVAVTGLSASTGTWKHFSIVVPAGQTKLDIVQSGGTGDADMYVKFGSQPTSSSYTYRPYLSGNNETVSVTNPSAGTWYISSYAYSSFASMSMKATYTGTAPAPTCTTTTGTLSTVGANAYSPSSSGYVSSVSGSHVGKLTGPSTADFDLYLEKWNGSAWASVAVGEGATSTENITYSGTSGTYRWRIKAYSGTGTWNLCSSKP